MGGARGWPLVTGTEYKEYTQMITTTRLQDTSRRNWQLVMAVAMAATLVMLGLLGIVGGGNAGAASVSPTFEPGNPECSELGYDFELKIEPVVDQTKSDGYLTVTINVSPDGNDPKTLESWVSNFGVDAVVVKGGRAANVYDYSPEATSDTNLVAPGNAGLSHISFCYDIELQVSKTANTTFTRTHTWDIDKSVTPDRWDLFKGDSGASQYTVEVTKTGFVDSDWAVSGTISIFNPAPFPAEITGVTDELSGFTFVNVNCGVTFPYVLAAGGTLECTYSTPLPDGTNRTNTATAETYGDVGNGSGSTPVVFGDPTTVVNRTINVDDTNGESWSFSDSGSVSYARTFECDTDRGTHDNTATIRETAQKDSASVTVNCYALDVTKNATTTFTRTWDWTIDKSADQTDLLLAEGQLFQVNYSVTVNATSTNGDFAVSGDIWVANPNPSRAAELTAVSDLISPSIAADVECPSLTVPASGSLHCTYSAVLSDASGRLNTATATLQNYDYDYLGDGTASGTTDFSGTANVGFNLSNPTAVVDECIDVSDTNVGVLGAVCASDAPKTFNYSLSIGAHPDADVVLECGDNTHVNTASFITNDTGTTGNDSWTVNADVTCAQGCTLTQGYWKTHSSYGPAPEDDGWFNLGDADGDGDSEGPDETFFLSGKTYYQVLWTPPAGNAYYILAHQYIAAKLNIVNGSSVPAEVQAAMTAAQNLLSTKTPAQIAGLRGAAKSQVTSLASTLDKYNNGLIGPGHCDA